MSDENTDYELYSAVILSLTRPTVLKFTRTSLGPTKTSEKKNVPAAGPSNTGDKKQNVDAEASETAASASKPPTGQPTLQPSTSETSKSQASTSKASKSKAPTSKASKLKASKSKASKSKASTSKESKSKSQELTSKTTKKTSSTPDNSEVRKGANANLPSGKQPSASTSAASSSSSSADTHIWLETLKSKFQCGSYNNLLRQSNFTERQAEALANLFHQTSRRMYNTFMNSDRVSKNHSCRECEFSIIHQCVSINFLPVGWPRVSDPKIATMVAPHTMTICICNFAFFHAHTSRPSLSKTVNTGSSKRIIASLRCPVCDTMVMIEHPQVENSCCTLTKWSGINSSAEEAFHAKLVDHLKSITKQTLSLDELYTCNHHCCLFFHRCTG